VGCLQLFLLPSFGAVFWPKQRTAASSATVALGSQYTQGLYSSIKSNAAKGKLGCHVSADTIIPEEYQAEASLYLVFASR
jgi:hypothetical protein